MGEIVHKHWIVLAIFTASSSLSYILDENHSTCSSCLINFFHQYMVMDIYITYKDYIQQQYMYFCSISCLALHVD